MKIVKSISSIRAIIQTARHKGQSVGFVPTMGALHEGHLSLLRRSVKENDITVLSIFVNPTQFGPKEDYKSYPRTLTQDARLAQKAGVDIIFTPSARTMYPQGHGSFVTVADSLTDTLCGRTRPGHFRGVATVVTKLLNIVTPDAMYLGQKDAQQCVVLKRLVSELNIPARVVVCPTVREKDGLAMSSRNKYLTPQQRREASALYQSLQKGAAQIRKGTCQASAVIRTIRQHIQRSSSGEIDYIATVHPDTLQPLHTMRGPALLAVAVRFGHARLIDNILVSTYNEKHSSRK